MGDRANGREMAVTTVVRRHVVAASLPEEFRHGIDPREQVTVTVEVEQDASEASALGALRDKLRAAREAPPIGDDPVARIRALRDEWGV